MKRIRFQLPSSIVPRDYQRDFVTKLRELVASNPDAWHLFSAPCGTGKCYEANTMILMYDGTTKPVQEIQVGDKLLGPDSQPRIVLSLIHGQGNLYRVTQKNGDSYTVNGEHILALVKSPKRKEDTYRRVFITVNEYLKKSKWLKSAHRGWKAGCIKWKYKHIEIPSYVLGLWLGDGDSHQPARPGQ